MKKYTFYFFVIKNLMMAMAELGLMISIKKKKQFQNNFFH